MSKSKRMIRKCWSRKKNGLIDFNSEVFCGLWIENKTFEFPDENKDEDLEQSFKRQCNNLNEKYPELNHFVEHKYI